MNVICKEDGLKTRGLVAYIIFNVCTCGFYNLYWMYSVGNHLAANAHRYGLNLQETLGTQRVTSTDIRGVTFLYVCTSLMKLKSRLS